MDLDDKQNRTKMDNMSQKIMMKKIEDQLERLYNQISLHREEKTLSYEDVGYVLNQIGVF